MDRKVIGDFHNPWRSENDSSRSLAELYRRAVWLKANPRDEAYMKALFVERYPQGVFVNADTGPEWRRELASADTVVMLYPDATGLYFSKLEAVVRREKKIWATVRVLNGRRRDFVWSGRARRGLRLRRFLERSMLGEALATVAVVVATPFFLISDLARGKR